MADLLLRAAAKAAIAGLGDLAVAVAGAKTSVAIELSTLLAAVPELAGADTLGLVDVADDFTEAGAASDLPSPLECKGVNASMRNSAMVKPAYSSGASPMSLRPCNTI